MSGPLLVHDAADVAVMIRDAVRAALGEREAGPAVLDRQGLAKALGCSVASVDRLIREGCPCVRLGTDPRFRVERVIAWLEKREVSK